jgi:hypothetical protein
MINAFCQDCDKKYRVKDDLAGKRIRCPQGHVFLIPNEIPSANKPTSPGLSRKAPSSNKENSSLTPRTNSRPTRRALLFTGVAAGVVLLILSAALHQALPKCTIRGVKGFPKGTTLDERQE